MINIESQYIALYFRILGSLAFIPISFSIIGVSKRFIFTLLLTLLVSFLFDLKTGTNPNYLAEFIFGFFTAFPFMVFFILLEGVVELLELTRGMSLGSIYTGLTNLNSSALSLFLKYYFISLFLLSGAFELFFREVWEKLGKYPPGSLDFSIIWELNSTFLQQITNIFSELFVIFVPIAFVFSLVNFVFAIISKFMPQVNLFAEAFVFRSIIGLVIVFTTFSLKSENFLLFYV